MFKIKNSTIHCSRGDGGTISIRLPMTDANGYIKYEDVSGNYYWYNEKTKVLYDSNYEESALSVYKLNMVYYEFQPGDKLTFNIYEKNGYDKEPLKTKEVIVEEKGQTADIPLTSEDTTFDKPVNKEKIYWYDITLNDDLTVICFDEDGAKEYIMYPAKGDE